MRIFAIETSCDETAIAIAEFSRTKVRVLSHIVLSQIPIHKKFGGVVPNLAKREHQRNLVPILLRSLKESKLFYRRKSDFQLEVRLPKIEKILEREQELLLQFQKHILSLKTPPIDAIAITYGPGLAPALWVGVNFAKALAYLWKKPLIPVNHMAGHLYSALLQKEPRNSKHEARNYKSLEFLISNLEFPVLALLVSGGHTELVLMRGHGKYKILGETLDDAAGEAFDKVARILGLGYPGGPEISRLAEKGDPKKYPLPSPMIHTKDYNFSFSGLKTATLYLYRSKIGTIIPKNDIAAAFQKAAVDVLVKKTIRAVKEHKVKTVLLGGGVAANKELRGRLNQEVSKNLNSCLLLPDSSLTGDNALMIATAAYFSGKKKAPFKLGADANVKLGD